MSATIDATLLLYGSDSASPRHAAALERLRHFAAGPGLLYVFWPVAMAYLRIVTHASIFQQPLDPGQARANLAGLIRRPHVRCPGEQNGLVGVRGHGRWQRGAGRPRS